MAYAEQRLGSERIKGAYAWRSLIEAGYVSSQTHLILIIINKYIQ
jgi:hypothetical protein